VPRAVSRSEGGVPAGRDPGVEDPQMKVRQFHSVPIPWRRGSCNLELAVATFIKLTFDNDGNSLWLDWHRIVYMYPVDIEDHRETRRVTVLVVEDRDDLWVKEPPEQIVGMVDPPEWRDTTR